MLRRRRPLKVGIDRDLIVELAGVATAAEIKHALRVYTANKVYRSKLRAGATRYDLAGMPAGIVTQEHAIAADPKPAVKPKPVTPPSPKRLSLSDLREAAQRRKTIQPTAADPAPTTTMR
jgi:sRNA-binding protein